MIHSVPQPRNHPHTDMIPPNYVNHEYYEQTYVPQAKQWPKYKLGKDDCQTCQSWLLPFTVLLLTQKSTGRK